MKKITSLILAFLMFICCISNVGAVNIYAADTSKAILGDKITTFSVISPQSNEDGSGDIGGTGLTAGDVLITNGTSFDGITGHAAIVVSPTEILHIAGPDEKPEVVPKDVWMSNYLSKGWVKVFRHENNTVARKAAKWARETYENSNASYFLTPNLYSTSPTYCSKIVWQAYYYWNEGNDPYSTWPGLYILPYDLETNIKGLTCVYTYD